MLFTAQRISYQQTNHFSKIIIDYLNGESTLKPFYAHPPNLEGVKAAIEQKKGQPINREVLFKVFQEQYSTVKSTNEVEEHIKLLRSEATFTICTAHQPNLFTGPLYFIYKILHVIKLSRYLKEQLPQYNFVPVYYMGSEDADLDELNHIYLQGKKYQWTTTQSGAVGRMIIDKKLTGLLKEMEGQLSIEPHGNEILELLNDCYTEGKTIQQATFEFVNTLLGSYGVLVLIPDSRELKRQMEAIFLDDLFHQRPSSIVEQSSQKLNEHYNVQASPREINLFYIKDNIRERIIRQEDNFLVNNTSIRFSPEEITRELKEYPERFSPNVILRGLFQETILPDLAFIGGGGEMAYWLQLKALFDHYTTPFPLLILRNSFLVIEKKWDDLIRKLNLTTEQLFLLEQTILDQLLEREGKKPLLNGEVAEIRDLYDQLKLTASNVDSSLLQHVEALKTKATNQLMALEKKMVRAERKKHMAQQAQISKLKKALFPGGLQERVENMAGYYAKWGPNVIAAFYENSLTLEQEFVLLKEKDKA